VSGLEATYEAISTGNVDEAAKAVEKALSSDWTADDILNKALIAAMDQVGRQFAEGELFIPQVLWAAKAMQAGMDVLAPHFAQGAQAKRATVVIGTVKGDIHDIGKNLVSMMLGASCKVVDLGVDVAPEKFIARAKEERADIIALSALLTTTMQSMAQVVSLGRSEGLSAVKVIIGGAPVSESFAEEIGADAYGMDAMDAVQQVRELLGNRT
jgi:5-methyltetrahydrofolate--homocysteine methyltransferase